MVWYSRKSLVNTNPNIHRATSNTKNKSQNTLAKDYLQNEHINNGYTELRRAKIWARCGMDT